MSTAAPTIEDLAQLAIVEREARVADRAAAKVCTRCKGAGGGPAWERSGWTCNRCGGDGIDPTKECPAHKRTYLATDAWKAAAGPTRLLARWEGATGDSLSYVGRSVALALEAKLLAGAGVYSELSEWHARDLDLHPLAVQVVEAICSGRQTKALRPATHEALKVERHAARNAEVPEVA